MGEIAEARRIAGQLEDAGADLWILAPEAGLGFRWSGAHGVSIFTVGEGPGLERVRLVVGEELDIFHVGDFGEDGAGLETVIDSIARRIAEARAELEELEEEEEER